MSEYKPVPVDIAKQIAESFDKSIVVLLCYDPTHNLTHTTTYGVNAYEKEQAAALGEMATQAIGCDLSQKVTYEDFHKNYDAARYKAAIEVLADIVSECDDDWVDPEEMSPAWVLLYSRAKAAVKACGGA